VSPTQHATGSGQGMFGNSIIFDEAYSTGNGGGGTSASQMAMCVGTAGAKCSG
jgi:hypothetical protein